MDDFNNENNGGVNLTKEPEPQDTGNQGESNVQQNFGGIPEQPVQQQPNPPIQQPFNNPNMGNMGGYNPNPNMNPNMNQNPNQPQPGQGLAIASLVIGILSIVGGCCCNLFAAFLPLNLLPAIVGLILGIMANKKAKSGLATGGIVTSIIGLVFGVVCLLLWILVAAGIMASPEFLESFEDF